MERIDGSPKRRPGRPLGFDRKAALRQAMLLFWQHGYEATSVNELIKVMNITPPSLYTAFGDKKRLFLETVQLYMSGPLTAESIIDDASSAREAVLNLLDSAVVGFTGESTPAGCLLANSAISCSSSAVDVQRVLAEIRLNIEKRLLGKLVQDREMGMLKLKVEAETMASFIMAVIQGMSILARDGATREKLSSVSAAAMISWRA